MAIKDVEKEELGIRPEMVQLSDCLWVDRATAEACGEVNRGKKMMLTDSRARRPDRNHPDVRIVETWLAKENAQVGELEIIFRLCYVVRSEWLMLPKRTKSQHRKFYLHIESLCHELKTALDESGSHTWGLTEIRVDSLFNEIEKNIFPERSDGHKLGSGRSIQGHFPIVEELLNRLAEKASEIATQDPLHAQPGKRGAERGYFVRRIGELLQQRYARHPHEVIAALTTIALGEDTDRELVAKLLK